jgi:S-adenosylmethionine hydrolase
MLKASGFITLLTDFGLSDAYVGMMKGVIAQINPKAAVIDLCHQVTPQEIKEAAFLLASSYAFFPPGTIHVAVVDPTVGGQRKALCLQAGDFYFIGPDNGVLSIACSRAGMKEMRILDNEVFFLKTATRTFHGRDVFAPAAAHLSAGADFHRVGPKLLSMKRIRLPLPQVRPGLVSGRILYRDRFGNLISNIAPETIANAFPALGYDRLFISVAGTSIRGLGCAYYEVPPGSPIALFSSYNFLEIAVREGNAADVLRAGEGAKVTIEAAGRRRG